VSNDDDDLLGPLAHVEVPAIDPTSRDRIESGLRVRFAEDRVRPVRRRLPRRLVLAPVLVVILAITTVVLVAGDETSVAALEVRDAQDVVVTLPSGERVRDPVDGFVLVDGATVAVGDRGTITIDDITLDPGAVVTVRDGRLVTDVVATTTTGSPPITTRPVDRPPDDRPPVTAPTESSTPDFAPSDSRPTVTDAPPTTDVPGRDDPPTDESPDRPTDTSTVDPEPVDTSATDDRTADSTTDPGPDAGSDGTGGADDLDVAVALRVESRRGEILVAWSVEGADVAGWSVLLLRTVDGSAPEGPGQGVTVAQGRRGEVVETRADLPDEIVAVRYRVVVVDGTGGVVARSEIQTLNPGDS
jgi:hypothetical protein